MLSQTEQGSPNEQRRLHKTVVGKETAKDYWLELGNKEAALNVIWQSTATSKKWAATCCFAREKPGRAVILAAPHNNIPRVLYAAAAASKKDPGSVSEWVID